MVFVEYSRKSPKLIMWPVNQNRYFFKAVLEQVCYFCSPDSSVSSINAMIASVNGDHAKIEYAKGSCLTVDQESANVISLLRKYQNKKYQDALLTDLHKPKDPNSSHY